MAERADIARKEDLLPLGLGEGIHPVKEVRIDKIIRYNDIEMNEDSFFSSWDRYKKKTFY